MIQKLASQILYWIFQYQIEYLLAEWMHHFLQPGLLKEGDKIYAAYVTHVSGMYF